MTDAIAGTGAMANEESIRQENMHLRAQLTVMDRVHQQTLADAADHARVAATLRFQMGTLVQTLARLSAGALVRAIRRVPVGWRAPVHRALMPLRARLRRMRGRPPLGTVPPPPPRPAMPRHAIHFGTFTQDTAELAASPWYDAVAPRVSVVILNWNRSAMTLACVRYVLRHTQGYRFEVIVVDNGSSAEELALLTQSGLPARVIALGSNRYFGEANNIAAESARGEYLFFLNNDAFVHEAWLEPLIAMIERGPHVGAVGSRLIYPDGTLQEAGALISWDGIAHQLGKFSVHHQELYGSLRQVDYVSAAALLMRRQDFLDVLGFDLCWEPAYFEDVDLCLKLRARGKQIYYCPTSVVTHIENATSLDKRHNLHLENVIEANRTTFVSRWGDYLLGGPAKPPAVLAPPRRRSGARRQVALYTPFFLTPGGGERYLLSIAQALADGADLTLVTPARCSLIRLRLVGRALQLDISGVTLATLDEAQAGPEFDMAFVIGNAVLPPLPGLGRRNIFICQFPFPMRDADRAAWHGNLAAYELVVVYSDYARRHFERSRDGMGLPHAPPVQTVTPPVHLLRAAPAKKRMILSVGRFFAGHHCKRQDLMVEAFSQLIAAGVDCELHLAGSLRPEPEHRAYYLGVVNAAKGLPVVIHPNTDADALAALYADSLIYWHLTGMGADLAQEPERAEHFGIAVVEAMSAGCVPVAFGHGGPAEIITPGVDGYLVEELAQLIAQTRAVLDDPALAQSVAARAVATARRYDETAFAGTVQDLGRGAVAAGMSQPPRDARWDRAMENFAVPAFILVAITALSVHLGPDAAWDLRNYHIYDPFALLHKPAGFDLIPAQMQSFLPPTLDLIPYWLRFRLNAHPDVLDAVLGLPEAVAAILAFRIGVVLLPPGAGLTRRWPLVLLAVAFGVTGAAGLPTIGTSTSEMPGAICILGGVLLLLQALGRQQPWRWTAPGAGALFGVALGLKLTLMPFALAGAAMFVLCMQGGLVARIRHAAGLAAGVAVGALVVGGPWWLHMYHLTGNPIFPYFNNIFRSPLTAPIAMQDGRFWPHGAGQALLYPFYWGFEKNRRVTELVMRDPRLAFAMLAWVALVLRGVLRRGRFAGGRAGLGLAVFMAVGYGLWEWEFAIFRYVAPVELLTGLLILLALQPLLGWHRWAPAAALVVICAVTLPFTRYPHWDRAAPNGQAASIAPMALPPGSMVLLLTADPMAYIAAFVDPAVRFVGVNNNLVRPGDGSGLGQRVEAAVRSQGGPLWGLEIADPAGRTEAVLAYYGLHRGPGCTMVQSNLEGPQVRFCPLLRAGAAVTPLPPEPK